MTPSSSHLKEVPLSSPTTLQRETSFHFLPTAFCRASSFVLHSNSTLEMSSENVLFSPVFILSFHLIDTISFHNNYIITNNSMAFPCGSPAAVNVRFSPFLATSTFHPHSIGMMKLLSLTKAKRASREGGGKKMS